MLCKHKCRFGVLLVLEQAVGMTLVARCLNNSSTQFFFSNHTCSCTTIIQQHAEDGPQIMADNAGQTTYAGHDKLMVVASNYWRARPPPRVEHQNQVHLPNLVRFPTVFPTMRLTRLSMLDKRWMLFRRDTDKQQERLKLDVQRRG
jgi:hypothetical protein